MGEPTGIVLMAPNDRAFVAVTVHEDTTRAMMSLKRSDVFALDGATGLIMKTMTPPTSLSLAPTPAR